MNRNLPYMKIAVCTSEVQIGEQIREYVDEFTGKGNAQIQVDVMKNCYRLAKKILNREHYDVICIGKNLRDIDSYTFASSIRMADRETIFFLPGWNRLNLNQIEHLAPVSYLSMPLSKDSEKNSTAPSATWDPEADIFLLTHRDRKDASCTAISNTSEKAVTPSLSLP